MLMGLKQPLVVEDRFPLLLIFDQAEQTLVQVVVQMVDTQGAGQTPYKHDQTGSVAANGPGPVKRFELYIQHGKILTDERTIRVSQGDQVELYWSSDKPDVLHLHGYDIHTKVTPHVPAAMQFKAFASGRFSVKSHGGSGHASLIYLEVHPK